MKPLIIDCFVFSEEIDILKIRLSEMYPVCDQIIIIESNKTQTRLDKPFNFEKNIKIFKPWIDKITYYKLESYAVPTNDFCWAQEKYQRSCMLEGIRKYEKEKNITLEPTDYINFGDVDEIVNGELLNQTVKKAYNLISFNHIFGSYFLNYYAKRYWYGCVLTKWENIELNGFQYYREIKDRIFHVEDKNLPSWHFSSVGSPVFDFNWHKWKTRIEPKEKSFLVDENFDKWKGLFNKCIIEDKYFFHCDDPYKRDQSLKLDKLPIETLPLEVQKNLDKYQHLII